MTDDYRNEGLRRVGQLLAGGFEMMMVRMICHGDYLGVSNCGGKWLAQPRCQ